MICELLPNEIVDLIVSAEMQNVKDPELDMILPPRFVRDVVVGEKGVKAPPSDDAVAQARGWCSRQREVQSVTARTHHLLMEKEPLTHEMARAGQLPRWSVESWAPILRFDWSGQLEAAMVSAMDYIDELDSKKASTH